MNNSLQKTFTYLALGDSYTIGEKVNPEENFPNQAAALLREKGIQITDPFIIAKTGWTTDELNEAIQKAALKETFDFVTLLIGVNNQYRGKTVADYAPEFESLLRQAIAFAGNDPLKVAVLSIPDWGITPYAEGRDRQHVAWEIDAYNQVNRTIASKHHIHYIDITPWTRQAVADSSLLAEDGLHPSAKEYARWADSIAAFFLLQIR